MPTYDYVCDSCGNAFERFQPITAPPVKDCPACHRPSVRRLISGGSGVLFKGSGFYQTDYRSKNYQEAAKKDQPEKTPASGPSVCKPPEVCSPEKK